MANWGGWDITLFLVAVYVAAVSLLRLMRHHQHKVMADLEQELQHEQQRKKAEEKRIEKEKKTGEEQAA